MKLVLPLHTSFSEQFQCVAAALVVSFLKTQEIETLGIVQGSCFQLAVVQIIIIMLSQCFLFYFLAHFSSSLTDLFTSLLTLVLSWLVGIAFPAVLSLLLTYTGHSLTWYCRPYLLVPLFGAPALFGIGFVHYIARRSLVSKVC